MVDVQQLGPRGVCGVGGGGARGEGGFLFLISVHNVS